MIKLSKEKYLDKLHACWIGKNIGGTLGTPYEGSREFRDVKGFVSPSGEPLPNDDLDLQLAWLHALETVGPKHLNANVLGEIWLGWITPHWNEYGICKTNLALGLLPPMSGEVDNEKWKTSNGAWIRSEIWAAIAPGAPDIAVKYAVMDAMVDHGIAEGVCAEIFTAAMQSCAYVESDIRAIINTALKKIPENSKVAETVRLVIDCYDKGIDYKETRERVVEFNKDLGWFQAPGNLGFVTIGLLYGEGDFKKSLIYAVNCGDDTDCTGATVGALLGIVGGSAGIPKDWAEYIGDRIMQICISAQFNNRVPKTCGALTERVFKLVPDVMKANGVSFEFADEDEYTAEELEKLNSLTSDDFLNRAPYSYDILNNFAFNVRVEMDKTPRVKSGEVRHVKLTFDENMSIGITRRLFVKLILPEGFTVGDYDKNVLLEYRQLPQEIKGRASVEFDITAGERVEAVNRCYAEITAQHMPAPVIVPITFIA